MKMPPAEAPPAYEQVKGMFTQAVAAAALERMSNEPEPFEELVREHQAMVFSMACRYLRNRALAEEIAQEVFLQLYKKLPELESPDHVLHWLRWVTAHRLIDHSRQEKRRPQAPLESVPEPAAASSERDPLLADMLRQLVAELPENARVVMILRYQEDLDPMDIARALDMPIATVKSHLQRSLALLRDKLSRQKGVGI